MDNSNLVMTSFNAVELIRRKRDGGTLSGADLQSFIGGYVKGEIPDYQMSAFLMAVYFKGMTAEERSILTDVMLHSGEIVDLSAIPGIKVDKHSTGGVGDKVSLILAPMVAACGVPVPMISGRGLGHTGGTLDKLEAIPGFSTSFSIADYKNIIRDIGVVLIGQTKEIAPADKKMYALRDVTGTVESVPLIAGSIMSKKLAEGIDALVLDVKTGNGAFMHSFEESVALAEALISIGTLAGKHTVGFITDMNQPLGFMIGNWLEVVESVECLRGKNVSDLMEVTYTLGGAMVHLGGKADSIETGMQMCRAAIWSGKAYELFLRIVERQGGDVTFIRHPEGYPTSSHAVEVRSQVGGYVQGFETERIGVLASELGAGRRKVNDIIDPKAGIALKKKIGDRIEEGEPLAAVYTDREYMVDRAMSELKAAIHVGEQPVALHSSIVAYVDAHGVRRWTPPKMY
jgi:pyrimidine-nucleoside phosphorylase